MDENWDELIAALTSLSELSSTILETGRRKKEALVNADLDTIEELTKKEEFLLVKINKIEIRRQEITKVIAAAYGAVVEGLGLNELEDLAPPAVKVRMKILTKAFSAIMRELLTLNSANTELINQAIDYTNYNINILTQCAASPTYASQGREDEEGQTSIRLFDQKI